MKFANCPIPVFVLLISACATQIPLQEETASSPPIDQRSYRLGGIGTFAEMVSVGVKELALSAPMTPEEMDNLIEDAERIAQDNGVMIYRESDFLVTDLFPESVTKGNHVLLIYLDPVKDKYMALKAEKQRLIERGEYVGEARLEIARKVGRLLSYPEERIEEMLSRNLPSK